MKINSFRKKKIKFIFIFDAVLLIALFLEFCCLIYLEREENKKELDTWLGGYRYCGQLEEDEISIFEINGKYYAELTCWSSGVSDTRSLGYIKGDKNSINIFFKDTLPGDSIYEEDCYKKNELLIVMSYIDTELQTSWYALRQECPSISKEEGEIEGIYFEKISVNLGDKR